MPACDCASRNGPDYHAARLYDRTLCKCRARKNDDSRSKPYVIPYRHIPNQVSILVIGKLATRVIIMSLGDNETSGSRVEVCSDRHSSLTRHGQAVEMNIPPQAGSSGHHAAVIYGKRLLVTFAPQFYFKRPDAAARREPDRSSSARHCYYELLQRQRSHSCIRSCVGGNHWPPQSPGHGKNLV